MDDESNIEMRFVDGQVQERTITTTPWRTVTDAERIDAIDRAAADWFGRVA